MIKIFRNEKGAPAEFAGAQTFFGNFEIGVR